MADTARRSGNQPADHYWASVGKDRLAEQMQGRIGEYFDALSESGRLNVMRRSLAAYQGQDSEGRYRNSAALAYGGESGELTLVKVNHYRSLIQHVHVMATQNRPAFDARAVNADHKSMSQAVLAEGLLDFYLSEKGVEDRLIRAAETALKASEGWVSVTWDHHAGEPLAVDMQPQEPPQEPSLEGLSAEGMPEGEPANDNGDPWGGNVVKEGDVRVEHHAPWDVARDPMVDPDQAEWLAVRRPVNKWNLAAKYGGDSEEQRLKILRSASDDSFAKLLWDWQEKRDQPDRVAVWELFHDRTDALPQGRHAIMVGDLILYDGPLPYEGLPLHSMIPSLEEGEGGGYSSMWDLLALQEVLDSVVSTAVSNHDAFGTQNILIPDGSNIGVSDLAGGLRAIKYRPDPSGAKVEPLQLLRIDKSTFELAEFVVRTMETLSGVNKVSRGDPPPQLKSGTALALVQTMSLQYNSGIQRSYARLLEKVGTAIIRVLQQYAHTPRVAEIVGKDKRPMVQEFAADDVSDIRRVVVDVGNPLTRTTSGRVEIADKAFDRDPAMTFDQYIQVIETGRLEPITQRGQSQLMNVRAENEQMSSGQPAKMLITDDHRLHIAEHLTILDNPEVRMDDALAGAVLEHITQHQQAMMMMDPVLAELTNQAPLQSMMMMPPGGPMGSEGAPPPANDNGEDATAQTAAPPGPDGAPPMGLPQMPVDPMSGERLSPNGGMQ